jgi:F420-non-reducing hydrogenase iron-sulfur subunit
MEQNYKAMRRFSMLKHHLRVLGIEDERVRLQWASAAEGTVLAEAINEMVGQVRQLGPLNWPGQWSEGDEVESAVVRLAEEHAEAMEVPA